MVFDLDQTNLFFNPKHMVQNDWHKWIKIFQWDIFAPHTHTSQSKTQSNLKNPQIWKAKTVKPQRQYCGFNWQPQLEIQNRQAKPSDGVLATECLMVAFLRCWS